MADVLINGRTRKFYRACGKCRSVLKLSSDEIDRQVVICPICNYTFVVDGDSFDEGYVINYRGEEIFIGAINKK